MVNPASPAMQANSSPSRSQKSGRTNKRPATVRARHGSESSGTSSFSYNSQTEEDDNESDGHSAGPSNARGRNVTGSDDGGSTMDDTPTPEMPEENKTWHAAEQEVQQKLLKVGRLNVGEITRNGEEVSNEPWTANHLRAAKRFIAAAAQLFKSKFRSYGPHVVLGKLKDEIDEMVEANADDKQLGAKDPVNIIIVYEYDTFCVSHDGICKMLKNLAAETGATTKVNISNIAARYQRTARTFADAEGRDYIPLMERRQAKKAAQNGKKSRTPARMPARTPASAGRAITWDHDLDQVLRDVDDEYDTERWNGIAKMFNEQTGHNVDAAMVMNRMSLLKGRKK